MGCVYFMLPDAKPKGYGEVDVKDRVDGAELLQAAEAAGQVRGKLRVQ